MIDRSPLLPAGKSICISKTGVWQVRFSRSLAYNSTARADRDTDEQVSGGRAVVAISEEPGSCIGEFCGDGTTLLDFSSILTSYAMVHYDLTSLNVKEQVSRLGGEGIERAKESRVSHHAQVRRRAFFA